MIVALGPSSTALSTGNAATASRRRFESAHPNMAAFLRRALSIGRAAFNFAILVTAVAAWSLQKEQTEISREQRADKTQEQVLEVLKDIRANQNGVLKQEPSQNRHPSAAPTESKPPREARSTTLNTKKKPKARHVRRKADKQKRKEFRGHA